MTQEHAITAYKHFKEQLENPNIKKIWKDNIQHGFDSIKAKFEKKGIDIDKIISEEKEAEEEKEEEEKPEDKPTKSKKGK